MEGVKASYSQVLSLLEQHADDPDENPYSSLYEAVNILKDMLHVVETLTESDGCTLLAKCVINYQIGYSLLDTDLKSDCRQYFLFCLNEVDDLYLSADWVVLLVSCLNSLGLHEFNSGVTAEAEKYLHHACDIYKKYLLQVPDIPQALDACLRSSSNPLTANDETLIKNFENCHTKSLFYLAQFHQDADHFVSNVLLIFVTLERQLRFEMDMPSFNRLEWGRNCTLLSDHLINGNRFSEARHLLAAADQIILKYHTEDTDRMKQYSADISRHWIKYCNALFSYSISAESEETVNPKLIDDGLTFISKLTFGDNLLREKRLRFPSFDDKFFEGKIMSKKIDDFPEARSVFLFGQSNINRSKDYYDLYSHASDYIDIIQDYSKLFYNLAFFEEDLHRRCQMCKRRIDMLESLLSELNPQHYLHVCRQLQFEIAQVFSDMVDFKQQLLTKNDGNRKFLKINQLISQAIVMYEQFLTSMRDKDGNLPSTYAENYCRPALITHFYLGRLYGKKLCSGKERISNTEKSLKFYSYLVDFCDKNPEVRACVLEEYELCAEMMTLLPGKIKALQSGASL